MTKLELESTDLLSLFKLRLGSEISDGKGVECFFLVCLKNVPRFSKDSKDMVMVDLDGIFWMGEIGRFCFGLDATWNGYNRLHQGLMSTTLAMLS